MSPSAVSAPLTRRCHALGKIFGHLRALLPGALLGILPLLPAGQVAATETPDARRLYIQPNGHILIDVDLTLGGRTLRNRKAMVDFGAEGTIIDASLVAPGETHRYLVDITDSTGTVRTFSQAAWVTVTAGPATSVRSRAILMDLHSTRSSQLGAFDMVIGVEVFRGMRIGFDLSAGRLLDRPITAPDLDLGLEWTADHLPCVTGRLNGCEVKWLLDTGSKIPVSIPQSLVACATATPGPGSSYSGMNRRAIPIRSTLENSIRLGGQTWHYQTAWIDQDSDPSLGLSFFEGCQLEFDFIAYRFRVRRLPTPAGSEPVPSATQPADPGLLPRD